MVSAGRDQGPKGGRAQAAGDGVQVKLERDSGFRVIGIRIKQTFALNLVTKLENHYYTVHEEPILVNYVYFWLS